MKRQAYESTPLPISWNHDDYVMGTRDAAYLFDMVDQPIDLGIALNFVKSNDPRFKKLPDYSQEIDYIPSKKFTFKIDSAAVVKNGALDLPYRSKMLKEMQLDYSGKTTLGKQELIILDMLQTNNWERSMYYAFTVSPDQFVNLDGSFQQTGMAYQIVPLDTKTDDLAVNTDRMYDNVMNKFKWGGVDTPGVYIDENTMRMCRSYRMYVFGRLATALIKEEKYAKAANVLDKCMEVLPSENVPLDYSILSIAENYYILGQKEKAAALYQELLDSQMRNIRWFFRLKPYQLASVVGTLETNLYFMQEALRVIEHFDPDLSNKYREEFDNFRMAYTSVSRD
jgi:tetratricopeptide (TPR) repeat protein